jgi:sporulation protein YlmC with PRC-barrel domain
MNNNKYEVDNLTGVNHEGVNANTPVERLTATSIMGDNVVNTRGDKLGTIKELMVNIVSGKIEYAILDFESLLGKQDKLFAVPFSDLRVKTSEHAFILDRDKNYLKSSPGFNKEQGPDIHDQYYNDVNAYYSATSDSFLP